MKLYKQIIFILVVFFKTETVLSENNLFNVNNILLEKNDKSTNNELANKAIKKGFDQFIEKILLKEDLNKISDLSFSNIKQLVTYYQISNVPEKENNKEIVSFSVTFDKDKIHDLFYKRGISYSEIFDKELYILPILIQDNELFIFNNNFFYQNWNKIYDNDLIEFILPLENIEIIQNINQNKNNLISIETDDIFKEYSEKNSALIMIEYNTNSSNKVYLKTKIQGKKISKSLDFKNQNLKKKDSYKDVLRETKKEIINIVKSENLIDISTPSFISAKLNLDNKNNLVKFNSRIKKIGLIENIYVQEFNKDFMLLRIKYLGKLNKILNQLKSEKIDLKLINDQWLIKIL